MKLRLAPMRAWVRSLVPQGKMKNKAKMCPFIIYATKAGDTVAYLKKDINNRGLESSLFN